MLCHRGRSYRVNEYRKDTSFSSIIRCMLVILVTLVAIYCLILAVTKTKEPSAKTKTANQLSHLTANKRQHHHIQAVDGPNGTTENSTNRNNVSTTTTKYNSTRKKSVESKFQVFVETTPLQDSNVETAANSSALEETSTQHHPTFPATKKTRQSTTPFPIRSNNFTTEQTVGEVGHPKSTQFHINSSTTEQYTTVAPFTTGNGFTEFATHKSEKPNEPAISDEQTTTEISENRANTTEGTTKENSRASTESTAKADNVPTHTSATTELTTPKEGSAEAETTEKSNEPERTTEDPTESSTKAHDVISVRPTTTTTTLEESSMELTTQQERNYETETSKKGINIIIEGTTEGNSGAPTGSTATVDDVSSDTPAAPTAISKESSTKLTTQQESNSETETNEIGINITEGTTEGNSGAPTGSTAKVDDISSDTPAAPTAISEESSTKLTTQQERYSETETPEIGINITEGTTEGNSGAPTGSTAKVDDVSSDTPAASTAISEESSTKLTIQQEVNTETETPAMGINITDGSTEENSGAPTGSTAKVDDVLSDTPATPTTTSEESSTELNTRRSSETPEKPNDYTKSNEQTTTENYENLINITNGTTEEVTESSTEAVDVRNLTPATPTTTLEESSTELTTQQEIYSETETPEMGINITEGTTEDNSGAPTGSTAKVDGVPRTAPTTITEKSPTETPEKPTKSYEQTNTEKSENKKQQRAKEEDLMAKSVETCQTAECKRKASKILQLIDHSQDPCEDLFQYACGGESPSSKVDPRVDVLLRASFKAKNSADEQLKSFYNFFQACVQYQENSGYSQKLKEGKEIRANNLTDLLAFLMLRQTTPLFEVRFGLIDNSEGYGLQVLPPSDVYDTAILKDWSLQSHIEKHCSRIYGGLKYEEEINLQSVYDEYVDCKNRTFWRMVEDGVSLNGLNQSEVREYDRNNNFFFNQASHVSDIDIEDAIRRHVFTTLSVSKLSSKYTRVDWKMLFDQIGFNVKPSTPVHVYLEDEYFKDLMEDLEARDETELLNALKLYYQLQLYENLMAQKPNNEEFCMKQAVQLMPEIAETLFLEHSGISAETEHFKWAFEELKNNFFEIINSSHLEDSNKSVFKEKLNELELEFAQNDIAKDEMVANTDYYLSDLFELLEKQRRIAEKPTLNRKSVYTNQLPVFIPNTAIIVIPNSFIYTRVTQNTNQPTYVSEMQIKFHLSRAITLYLNEIAINCESDFYTQFMEGLWRNLESADDKVAWKKQYLTYNLNEQHSKKGAKEISKHNQIADNLALQIAFKSMFSINRTDDDGLPWISDDHDLKQQFFIITAQEFCEPQTIPELSRSFYETSTLPGMFRFDAMMRNSQDFSDVFECILGSRMYPSDEEKMEFDKFTSDSDDYSGNYPIMSN